MNAKHKSSSDTQVETQPGLIHWLRGSKTGKRIGVAGALTGVLALLLCELPLLLAFIGLGGASRLLSTKVTWFLLAAAVTILLVVMVVLPGVRNKSKDIS